MTLKDLYKYYGTWTATERALNVSRSNITYWQHRGYIPFKVQQKIEILTNGDLKAKESHGIDSVKKKKG